MEKTMTMVERCAKAIYEKRNGAGCKPWSQQTKTHRAPYLDDARAAIEAMHEEAIAIIEARLPLYTDIGQINALRECISSIKGAALKEQET